MKNRFKKCFCNDSLCKKCLLINCKDDNCNVHTIANKLKYKQRLLKNGIIGDVEKFKEEVKRLKRIYEKDN